MCKALDRYICHLSKRCIGCRTGSLAIAFQSRGEGCDCLKPKTLLGAAGAARTLSFMVSEPRVGAQNADPRLCHSNPFGKTRSNWTPPEICKIYSNEFDACHKV